MLYNLWIASICAGVINSTQHQACSKSLEAAGLQYGVTQKTKDVEHKVEKLAENETRWAPEEARFTITTIYTIGISKQIIIPFDMPNPFQRIELQGYSNKALIVLRWSF